MALTSRPFHSQKREDRQEESPEEAKNSGRLVGPLYWLLDRSSSTIGNPRWISVKNESTRLYLISLTGSADMSSAEMRNTTILVASSLFVSSQDISGLIRSRLRAIESLLDDEGSKVGYSRSNMSYSDIRRFIEYCPVGSIDAVVIAGQVYGSISCSR